MIDFTTALENMRTASTAQHEAKKQLAKAEAELQESIESLVDALTASLRENPRESILSRSADDLGLALTLARYLELLKIRSLDDPSILPTANSHYCYGFPDYVAKHLWDTFREHRETFGFYIYPSYQLTYRERNGTDLHTAMYVSFTDVATAREHQDVFEHLLEALLQHVGEHEVIRVWLNDGEIAEYKEHQGIALWYVYADSLKLLRERDYTRTLPKSVDFLDLMD